MPKVLTSIASQFRTDGCVRVVGSSASVRRTGRLRLKSVGLDAEGHPYRLSSRNWKRPEPMGNAERNVFVPVDVGGEATFYRVSKQRC